jgi:hypothetical protein
MNKGELKALVSEYMHRSDITDSLLDDWVDWACLRIGRKLRSLENEHYLSFSVTANPTALPADFTDMRTISFKAGRGDVTLRSVPTHHLTRWGNGGEPAVYSIKAKSIDIRPFQAKDYDLFYYSAPVLSTDLSTDAVLDAHPFIFLQAALIEAHTWAQDFQLREQALATFVSEVDDINKQAATAMTGDAPAIRSVI